MKIYIAAPIFYEAELEYNRKIAKAIEKAGHKVILPNYKGNTQALFEKRIDGLDEADLIVAILNGPDSDSGTSYECGYAHARDKYIIGFRTDIRENHVDGLNVMLRYGITVLVNNLDALISTIDSMEVEMNTMEE